MRFLFLCLVTMAACKPPVQEAASNIINIDSLLDAQVKVLAAYGIEKSVSVGDSVYLTKANAAVNWGAELEAFREIGLANRPMYGNAYSKSVARDAQSNLQIVTWAAKSKVPIKQIELYFLPVENRLKRLVATINMEDFYLTTNRTLTLDFSLLGELGRLDSYKISGSQNYFWFEPQKFSVNSIVTP